MNSLCAARVVQSANDHGGVRFDGVEVQVFFGGGKESPHTDEELEHAGVLDLEAVVGALEAGLGGDGAEGLLPDFAGWGCGVGDVGAGGYGEGGDFGDGGGGMVGGWIWNLFGGTMAVGFGGGEGDVSDRWMWGLGYRQNGGMQMGRICSILMYGSRIGGRGRGINC